MQRLRIGIDLDDVLLELVPAFLDYYAEHHGRRYPLPAITSYRLWEVMGGTRDDMIARFHHFYTTPHFANLSPTPGAQEGIAELANHYDLFIITNRPLAIIDLSIQQTEQHYPNRFAAIYSTNLAGIQPAQHITKAHACKDLGINLMIEDSLESAQPCFISGIPVLLLDKPWNQHPVANGMTRVQDWPEITTGIQQKSFNVRPGVDIKGF